MVSENCWGVLFCPKRSFNSDKRRERVERALQANRIEYDILQSENAGSIDRLMKILVNNGYKTIVVVGGDSALNDAVNCLMRVDRKTRAAIALGVIPNGVMNDYAHFWGLRENDVEKIVLGLKHHRVRKIDLGRINYTNKKGEACHRYFLNCINVGLVATIMNLRRKTRHFFGSRTLSFLFSFVMMIFQRLEYKMHLKINTDVLNRKVMTVCIGKAPGYGQTPNAVPYNGLLDVSVVYHPEMMQLFEGIYLFLRGKFLNHRSVHSYRTKEVRFFEARHALVGIDGRLMKTPVGEFTVRVVEQEINFLIPD